ncbi:MAG: histone deacetylase family protein [Acidimicrobiales bacterium]
MEVLLLTDPRFADHVAGAHHPERPERLGAVLDAIAGAGLAEAVEPVTPRAATVPELERVHSPAHVAAVASLCRRGGGAIDADTAVVASSYETATLAAGAGLSAIEHLDAGAARGAFCAVRPPGHHATPGRAMGFCLFNNIAVTAAALAERGERVLVVDFDVHHGNGTQDAFWDDPHVTYVSMHEHPLYPGTGRIDDLGGVGARGATRNLPFSRGATGDAHVAACDEVVAPLAERFDPTWLLLSAGFDAHRLDPLAGLELSAGDFGLITERLVTLVPFGRTIAFLEGGYDLDALGSSAAACVGALAGAAVATEAPTSGGPGRDVVSAACMVADRLLEQ